MGRPASVEVIMKLRILSETWIEGHRCAPDTPVVVSDAMGRALVEAGVADAHPDAVEFALTCGDLVEFGVETAPEAAVDKPQRKRK